MKRSAGLSQPTRKLDWLFSLIVDGGIFVVKAACVLAIVALAVGTFWLIAQFIL